MDWTINGRNVIVTGGSSGIGKATATALASEGALVTITSRSAARATTAAEEIRRATSGSISILVVDFADLASVRTAAAAFIGTHSRLDVLVNNAGVVKGRSSQTVDGHETTFATNHLGPFLFTCLLIDLLKSSAPSRVINTSSVAHRYAKEGIVFDDLDFEHRRYKFMEVYGHSKLANILHAHELNQRFGSSGITASAVHPGVVRTGFGRGGDSFVVGWVERLGGRWMRTPQQGADTIVWLATAPLIETSNGCYFEDREASRSTRHATDEEQARRLWDVSVRLTAEP